MQAEQATRATPPRLNLDYQSINYDISFAIQKVANGSIDKSCAEDIARNFRTAAESILVVVQDAMESHYGASEKADRFTAMQTVSGLLEAANLIDQLFEEA